MQTDETVPTPMETDSPTLDPASMNYRELQRACKDIGLPAKGKEEVMRKLLEDYLKDPERTLRKFRRATKTKDGWVDWRNHAAREILLEDLEPGGWLHGQDDLDAKTVYDVYQNKQEEFRDIPFGQFEVRYIDSTKQAAKRRERSAQEEEFLKHDRILHPRQSHNHRGEPVFDMDTLAKEQLRNDIKNKLHKQMKPMELWLSREVYQKYKLDIFRPRIYQEIRRIKFLNWLEKKRTDKRDEFARKKTKAAASVTFVRN